MLSEFPVQLGTAPNVVGCMHAKLTLQYKNSLINCQLWRLIHWCFVELFICPKTKAAFWQFYKKSAESFVRPLFIFITTPLGFQLKPSLLSWINSECTQSFFFFANLEIYLNKPGIFPFKTFFWKLLEIVYIIRKRRSQSRTTFSLKLPLFLFHAASVSP